MGEAKLLTVFASSFLDAVTFPFVFRTTVVNDGSAFNNLGRVGEKAGGEKSGRCGVKGMDVCVQSRKFGEIERIRGRFEGRKFPERGDVSKEMIKFTLEMCESWSVRVREITFVNGSDRVWFRRWERALVF